MENKMNKAEMVERLSSMKEFEEDFVYDDPNEKDDVFSDDGSVHVRRNGVRFVFWVGEGKEERHEARLAKEVDSRLNNQ